MTRRRRSTRSTEHRLAELEEQSGDPKSLAEIIMAEAADREKP
jgi:hypothetical protein